MKSNSCPRISCPSCLEQIPVDARVCDHCASVQGLEALAGVDPSIRLKSRKLAILFSILLGGLGLHKFYLGQHLKGTLYLLFCWTLVPMVIGWLDAIKTIKMGPFGFAQRYNRGHAM
ncbi:NINE protein [Shewanella waksmanii]|uniref:NINE protein n=1 Tax=Shewanella waksmanii TaxID=213783 RepID=UPI0037350A9B